MQVVDKYGNTFGQGHLVITTKSGKSKLPVVTVAWGNITGVLANQTDLQDALDLKVPTSRTLTINGVTQDLSADRSWTISTGITVNTTPITGGTSGRLLFDNASTVGETNGASWDGTNNILTVSKPTGAIVRLNSLYSDVSKFQFTQEISVGTPTEIGYISNQFGTGMILSSFNSLYFNAGNAEKMRISSSTGNVLINTTTDAGYKLDVNGTLRTTSNTYLATTAGFVGIGTTSPSAALHIQSGAGGRSTLVFIRAMNSVAEPALQFANSAGNLARIGGISGGGLYFENATTELMRISSIGNLLINTTTDAGYKLDVNGTARVTNLKIDPVGTINFSSPTISSNQSSISSTDGDKLLLSSSFWNTISAGQSIGLNATYVSLTGASGTTPSVGLTFFRGSTPLAEHTTFHFGKDFSEAIGITGRARGATQFFINRNIDASTSRLIDFQEFGTSRFIVNSTGNVLIGTTTDTGYKLDVNGSARVQASLLVDTLGTNNAATLGGTLNLISSIEVINKTQTAWISFATRNTSGSEVVYDLSNVGNIIAAGNVGIGTTLPSYKLEVANSTGYVGMAIRSLQNNNAELNFQNTAYPTPRWTIRASAAANGSSGDLVFQRNASTFPMTITSGDNVLINTTTDAGYKLDVNGTSRYVAQSYYGTFSESPTIYSSETSLNYSASAASLAFYLRNGFGGSGRFIFSSAAKSGLSGTQYLSYHTATFNPTSGTAEYVMMNLEPTINQTGGANGITRGLYIQPILTAAADFRVIETTAGNVIFNGGNIGVGTSAPVVRYHQSQTQGILARYDITNANADQNRAVWEVYSNTAATPDFFGRFGFKFEGGINNASRQFQLHVSDNTTPRFIVNGSGNVLIGTTTDAGYKLEVVGITRLRATGYSQALQITDISNSTTLSLGSGATNGGNPLINSSTGTLQINPTTNGTFALTFEQIKLTLPQQYKIYGEGGSNYLTLNEGGGSTDIRLWGESSTSNIRIATNNDERLRITTTGNVLIGTTTDAGSKLLLRGSGATSATTALRVENINASASLVVLDDGNVGIGTSSPQSGFKLDVSGSTVIRGSFFVSSDLYFFGPSNHNIRINGLRFTDLTTSTTQVNISTTGNLGIGIETTEASSRLQVRGSGATSATTALRVENTNASASMVVLDNGNVGIGTTTPSSIFDVVVSNGATPGLRFRGYSDASTSYLLSLGTYTYPDIFQITSVNGLVSLNNTGLYGLTVGTNNIERMRITSEGNMLINTTTDSGYRLDVNGTARVGATSGSGQLYIKGATGFGQYIYLDNGGSDLWTLIGSDIFVIDRGGTRILRANADAQVAINGNVNDASAQMQIESTTRGFLPPRMTKAQMLAIRTPSEGLMVYDTTNRKLCCYDGATWQPLF
jgi:hypothetical protein